MNCEQLLTLLVKEKYIAREIVEMKEQLEARDRMKICFKEFNEKYIIVVTKSVSGKYIEALYYTGFKGNNTPISLNYDRYNMVFNVKNIEKYSPEEILCYCLMRFNDTLGIMDRMDINVEDFRVDLFIIHGDIYKTYIYIMNNKKIELMDLLKINNDSIGRIIEYINDSDWSDSDEDSVGWSDSDED